MHNKKKGLYFVDTHVKIITLYKNIVYITQQSTTNFICRYIAKQVKLGPVLQQIIMNCYSKISYKL